MMRTKRLLTVILIGILLLGALPFTVSAASASVSVSGPNTVRTGDTITITLSVTGSELSGISGNISFDSSKLTFDNATSLGWNASYNGGTFSGYSNTPLNGTQQLLRLTFTVKAQAGETISVIVSGVQGSDGTLFSGSGSTYSKTVAPPPSTESRLASLTVSNATLSPAFNENTTSYSAGTVPFTTSKLNVTAIAKDTSASVSISGDSLTVGLNTVSVTVMAESGEKRVYTINVTRQQDPNYVPDSNNKVASITIDGYVISPPFSAGTTSYLVWLPYETTSITVKATPESGKASVKIEGGSNLKEGDNEIRIICTAESGAVQTYILIAKRATQDGKMIGSIDPNQNNNGGEYKNNPILYIFIPVFLVGGIGISFLARLFFCRADKAE